ELVPEVVRLTRAQGVTAPSVAGSIIPEEDRPKLLEAGVHAVYTPKDFELSRIMAEIVDLAGSQRARSHHAPPGGRAGTGRGGGRRAARRLVAARPHERAVRRAVLPGHRQLAARGLPSRAAPPRRRAARGGRRPPGRAGGPVRP